MLLQNPTDETLNQLLSSNATQISLLDMKCAADFLAASRAPARGETFLRPAPPAPLRPCPPCGRDDCGACFAPLDVWLLADLSVCVFICVLHLNREMTYVWIDGGGVRVVVVMN
jgi:hypothetical protein